MANKYIKKMLNIIIREMQVKTTMRYHLTLVRMPSSESINNNNGEGVEKREPSCIAGGNVNWYTTVEDGMEIP